MGPDCLKRAALGLVMAGVDIKDIVYDTVTIQVIMAEVYISVQLAAGLCQGLVCPYIGPDALYNHVTAVIGAVLLKGDGTVYVKVLDKGAQGVVHIVLPYPLF